MTLTYQPVDGGNRHIAAAMLADYSRELEPESFDEAEIVPWLNIMYDDAQAGKRIYWLAYADEQPVGFVVFMVKPGWFDPNRKIGVLAEFYIIPAVRGRGLGREMAEATFADMVARGASSLELGVLTSNTTALAFWQSLGLTIHHHELTMPLPQPEVNR